MSGPTLTINRETREVTLTRSPIGLPGPPGESALTADELAAIQGAASPSAANVMATMDDVAGGSGATNLSIANVGVSTLDVASDTGTDATIPASTSTTAGLATAAQISKLDGIAAGAVAEGATGDAFATSHLTAFAHGDIATAVQPGDLGGAALLDVGTIAGTVAAGDDGRLSDARTPIAHASSHAAGQSDAIKLDDLAATDDNTDLDATTSAHGLLPKLGGGTTNFLRADGTWAAAGGSPAGSNTQVQFNDSSAFGGDAGLTFDKTTKALTCGGALILSGDISSAAWTTGGLKLKSVASTLTDTSSSGTVAAATTNALGGNTIAASNPTTFSTYSSLRIAPPVAGSNVTLTKKYALEIIGDMLVPQNNAGPSLSFGGSNGISGYAAFGLLAWSSVGGNIFGVGYSSLRIGSGTVLAWVDTASVWNSNSITLALEKDATDILAQRRATNPQAYRAYNTWTDASNGEWGAFGWKTTSNALTIGAQANGSGTLRGVNYVGAFHNFSNYLALTEMTAPSAAGTDKVRLFAQDNGSGKTQLMAIFQSGAAVQIAIEP